MAQETARVLDLPAQQVADIYMASVVHDIGKIGVDTAILRKKGRLTEDEWREVKDHPERGAAIISCMPQLRHLVGVVRHHHERTDRLGYPLGLGGEDIPLGARVIAVCDAYDAMTSQRSYRSALSPGAARLELVNCNGSQFDGAVVEAFLEGQGHALLRAA